MGLRHIFFAGGGTGGHIYPAIAVAEKIRKLAPDSEIHFLCSSRDIDASILSKTSFGFTPLLAKPLTIKGFGGFLSAFFESSSIVRKMIDSLEDAVMVGVGGFAAAPACWAAHRLGVPVKLINTDAVPGKANKLIARWADEVFVQFEDTAQYFAKPAATVHVVGCPLRESFENPQPERIKKELGLDENKKILLITGASSGAKSVNDVICFLLDRLGEFADSWQIVHLTGRDNFEEVKEKYTDAAISHKVLDYCDDMPSLLAAADLCIGRSGAVSVAEYAAAGVPVICMPYPYHKDRQQYLNAELLVEAAAAVIVDDTVDNPKLTAASLGNELEKIMKDDEKRVQMRRACVAVGGKDAAQQIAQSILG